MSRCRQIVLVLLALLPAFAAAAATEYADFAIVEALNHFNVYFDTGSVDAESIE